MNASCLHVWRSGNSEPYLHTIHLMVGVGAFAAPVIASHFLGPPESSLEILFPLIGTTIALIPGLGFLLASLSKEISQLLTLSDRKIEDEKAYEHGSQQLKLWLTVTLFVLIIFLTVGIEKTMGMLLSTYATGSKHVHMSKSQGSQLTAVYWGGFAVARLLAIFVSTRVRASLTIYLCFGLILAPSCAVLLVPGSAGVLAACVGAIGLGVGPVYSTLMLIFEREHAVTTTKISGAFNAGSVLGQKVFIVGAAQLVERRPDGIFMVCIASVTLSLILLLATLPGRSKGKY